MATFTVTTTTNVDTLSGRTGDDTFNINGGYLTVDEDTRYGVNSNTSATMGTIAPSASLGGNIIFKGDKVRLIPYDTGSGNVPAFNTTISQGSASGLLIGVYSALNVAPTTPGSAMPVSGWIKIKQWNDVAYAAGALTGIGANATGADVVGWIEIVGEETRALTLNRLNNTSNKLVQGAWYEIGTTDGNNATTYQIPSNGVNQYHGGVWVETAIAGEYEFYSTTSDSALSSAVATNERKGKFCWISTGGVLRFGNDGTNNSGGYVPPAGRKIRIGNVFFTSAAAASRTQNNFKSTISTRYRILTTAAGLVDMDKCSIAWNLINLTNPAQCALTNIGATNRIAISNNANSLTMTNVGVGQIQAEGGSILTFSACLEGGTLQNLYIGRGQWSGANNYGIVFSNSLDFTGTNINSYGTSNRTSSQYPLYISGSNRIYLDGGAYQGRIWINVAADIEVKNFRWWEGYNSNVGPAVGDYITLVQTCTNGLIENIDVADGDMCSNVMFLCNTNCDNVKIRNLGTYSTPVTTGLSPFTNASTSRSTTTATVTTSSPHGLTSNNYVFVWQTNLAGITLGAKQITVTSSTTFTFVCSNTGGTSGYVNYVPTQQTSVTTLTNSQNVKIQNIHAHGTRSIIYTANNTNKNVYLENITCRDNPYLSLGSSGATNLRLDSVTATQNYPGVQSAVYGSHFYSGFQHELTGVTLVGTGLSWTRSGSTITVTAPNHGLTTNCIIQVVGGSSNAALFSGRTRTITVVDKDTFTYGGVAAGATSGTMDYFVPDSRLSLQMNEPNDDTSSLFTVNSGTPLFTGGGTWSALVAGDQATWTMERYIIGFTGIPLCLPWWTLGGGNEINYRLEYDIDRGSGFSGTFRNWFFPTSAGATTSGSGTVTMTSTTGVAVGDYIFGQGIPSGTKVQSVDNATTITMDANANETVTGQNIMFNYAPNETAFPSTGVKFKLRITLVNASTQPISFVYMPLSSNATSRAELYPQDVPDTQTVTITSGVANTRIQIYDTDADEELANEVVTTFPYTWTDPNPYVADRTIRIRAAYVDGTSAKHFIEAVAGVATSTEPDVAYRLNQTDDEVYIDNAIDGSTVTDVEFVDSTMHINIDAGSIAAGSLYAYEMYWLYTEEGIRDLGQTIEAVDQANYRVTGMSIKNITSPETPLSITGGWLVDSVTGLMATLLDTTGGSIFNAPDHIVPFATGSGVTPGDVTDIASAVNTALSDDFAAIPTASENADAVQTQLNDDFAAIPTAAENADAVWDEALSGHTTGGSAGGVVGVIEKVVKFLVGKK